MYKSLILLLMLGGAMPCLAQRDSSRTAKHPDEPFTNSLVASITLGAFTGFGAELKASIQPQINARLGFSTIGASYQKDKYTIDEVESSIDAKIRFTKVHLLAEYRPFTKSSFRIVGGAGYFFGSKATIHMEPTSNYTYRRLEITKEELGEVDGTINWSGIAPYLGIGMGNSIPRKQVNITMDAGFYMLSQPKVVIDATKLLEPNKANEQQLTENLKSYRWLPQLQLNLNYKLFSKKII